jgi:hypothetical protein
MRFILMILLLIVWVPVFGQDGDPGVVKFTWHTIVALLVGLYEVVIRVIPTVKDWSFLGKIIDIISWVSNFLNVRKKRVTGKLTNFVTKD